MLQRTLLAASAILIAACAKPATPPAGQSYLFVWAGDSAAKSSDFLGVIDATPTSARYGQIVASAPVGATGTHPHHTEDMIAANGHLLANGFSSGTTWLFDLSDPLKPRIDTTFGDLGGFSHPHSYIRMANGHVLTTFQYAAGSKSTPAELMPEGMAMQASMKMNVQHSTGGLVEMNERGTVLESGSAADAAIAYKRITPYSVLPLPGVDRAISTTTDMDMADTSATAEWIQLWRLSDLKLLKSIALKPGPRGDENHYTGEPRLLPDGKSVYIHTFGCGLYLLRGAESPTPAITFVRNFPGGGCGVPILTGHYWLQPVPDAHELVSLDITDPEHPREVSTLKIAGDELPHWISIDAAGRRIVLNSGGSGAGNRLYIIDLDPATGVLTMDDKFRDAGSDRPGVSLSGKTWPHGFTGKALPHGTVFSR
jgi:hypothetical protein